MERFEPRKRTAIDGRVWWCVYDNAQNKWSTYLCFGKYKTKREAITAITVYSKSWGLI